MSYSFPLISFSTCLIENELTILLTDLSIMSISLAEVCYLDRESPLSWFVKLVGTSFIYVVSISFVVSEMTFVKGIVSKVLTIMFDLNCLVFSDTMQIRLMIILCFFSLGFHIPLSLVLMLDILCNYLLFLSPSWNQIAPCFESTKSLVQYVLVVCLSGHPAWP